MLRISYPVNLGAETVGQIPEEVQLPLHNFVLVLYD